MGCAYSRICEENPRTFYVWNVDSEGRPVKPGRIEVTDNQLILHQKENVVVRWPLTSLRRYGFDSQVFSFECGRRCTTGAGVYAFKCRRAQQLFTILQECINNSGGGTTNSSAEDSEHMNSLSRPLLPGERYLPNIAQFSVVGPSSPTVDADGYLEPITAGSHLHYPGPSSTVNRVPGSPGSYICVHGNSHVPPGGVEGLAMSDWTSSLPRCCSLGSSGRSGHHYVNEMAEQCLNGMCIVNQYVNSPPGELNENTYVNSAMVAALSPGHLPLGCCQQCVDFNTNYAKLDDLLKQEQQQQSAKKQQQKDQHFYVNVKPDGARNSGSSGSSKCVSGRSSPTDVPVKTSLTSVASSHQRCYANLGSPTNSIEQAQVNYAVLDLDETAGGSAVVSPVSAHNSMYSLASSSPVKSPEGYAQIDFDKTVALSNSANPCQAINDDSMRKTRHNAVIPCNSQTV